MTLSLDPRSGISSIPAWILIIGFLVTLINEFANIFTLTTLQAQVVTFIAFAFTALAALLTNVETA